MEPLPWYKMVAPVVFVAGLAVLCVVKNLPRFRAMLLGIALLAGYGAAQDQISARLCPEYFTHYHNPIPGLTDPTLVGIAYGFLGSWWGGALFGYFAGIAATVGARPPLGVRQLLRPMVITVLGVAGVVAITGGAVAQYSDQLGVTLIADGTEVVPAGRRRALLVVCCYHIAAYVSAVVGSVVCCVWIAFQRRRGAQSPALTPPAHPTFAPPN